MQFEYFIPTRVIFGAGTLSQLATADLPGRKALIVITNGKSMRQFGYLERVQKLLKENGVESVVFDKILPNPILDHVMEGAEMAKAENCDFIIGLGGGSSIDSAKSIAIMCTNSGNYWDYIGGGTGGKKPLEAMPLPTVAITTTAGTGTEADPWTVITNEATNEKIGLGSKSTFHTYPTYSIVDPELMVSVPAHLTAFQGFDALFHATEGYLANVSDVMSDMYALKSIELIGKSLANAVRNGEDIDARGDIALANTLSGMVESTSSCISEHSIAHALGAFHGNLPHGAALIMISIAFYTYFAPLCPERFIDMAKALGNKDATEPMDFVTALTQLQKDCDVYGMKMSDYGVDGNDLEKYADNAIETMGKLFELNPAELPRDEVVKILKDSFQ